MSATKTTSGPSTRSLSTPCTFHHLCLPCLILTNTRPKFRYNTFASAGSDGTVSIWDHKSKKRLRQYSKYSDAVNSIAFNSDGTRLAVGVSYNWDEGAAGARAFGERNPKVWIRDIGDEVKVRLLFFLDTE